VGAGPTGVELAGTLGEINRFTISRDYRRVDSHDTRVFLVEAGPRILTPFSEKLATHAVRDLESLGVSVLLNTRVMSADKDGVMIVRGAAEPERIEAATVLWAAGVQPSQLNTRLDGHLDRQGRVVVGADLSLAGHSDVFVIGDQAHFADPSGKPLPGVAPVAMQQGRHLVKNLKREASGLAREPFRYLDKGQMATIGRSRALVEFGGLRLTGWLAWVAWLFIHIYYLIDFRNRVAVFFEWGWSYLTFRRGARLILSREWRSFRKPSAHP